MKLLCLYLLQDKRVAFLPYHALSPAERDIFNARKDLLTHLGNLLRRTVVKKEYERLVREEQENDRSEYPSKKKSDISDNSSSFLYPDLLNPNALKSYIFTLTSLNPGTFSWPSGSLPWNPSYVDRCVPEW